MTRINCVPVETLSDQHLLAEYKESTRPFNKVIKRLEKGSEVPTLTGPYRLGAGHETFFFDKLLWLWLRRWDLVAELTNRGVKVDINTSKDVAAELCEKLGDTPYWNKWKPTPQDMYVNMARLCHRHFKTDLSEFN